MRYVEVILPLAIEGTLTYGVPSGVVLDAGCRVIVEVGNKKYTGIVRRDSVEQPRGVRIKDVEELLDRAPIVNERTMQLWEWMAGYYCCTVGEVYRAAMPSSLRIESETMVRKVEDVVIDDSCTPSEREVLVALSDGRAWSVKDLERRTGRSRVVVTVRNLLRSGKSEVAERVQRESGYKAKTETWVRLSRALADEASVEKAMEALRRASSQRALLAEVVRNGEVKQVGNSALVKELERKGFVETYEKEVSRIEKVEASREAARLNTEQEEALVNIRKQWKEGKKVVLLHGVTSSGKTELYVHLMKEVVERGQQVLFLLPEIALTTQLTERLRSVIGSELCVYHSKSSDNERVEIWKGVLSGEGPKVVIGARSASLLPFKDLGLVIVDEEHEGSFKQQDPAPRYHGRNVALVLAREHGAVSLLGSATPSVESYYRAKNGKYGLVELKHRYSDIPLPEYKVVDMRLERKHKTLTGMVSSVLEAEIAQVLRDGKQVILFQNRRGFAPHLQCDDCGGVPKCVNCDVSLTVHKNLHALTCHYCGYTVPMPAVCPECGSERIRPSGYGTERIEDELRVLFPSAKVGRMDLDTMRTRRLSEQVISDFENHRFDILVGTQMVTKGLDFKDVRLVGILNADNLWSYPDYRSGERAYDLMTQVGGRCGRHGERGVVVLQTFSPENVLVKQVVEQDYEGMYAMELKERETFRFSPFYKLIDITLRHKERVVNDAAAAQLASELRKSFGRDVLGPDNPPVGRVQNLYIRKVTLKLASGTDERRVKAYLLQLLRYVETLPQYKGLRISIDVDP